LRRDDARLVDMLLFARAVMEYTKDVTIEMFLNQRIIQSAVTRELEIMGVLIERYEDVMQLSYDLETDVLYLSIGTPRRAISREMGDDVLLRIDPETGAIIGLTVFNFSTRSSLDSLPLHIDLRESV